MCVASENNESPPGDCDVMMAASGWSGYIYCQKTTNPRQGIVTRSVCHSKHAAVRSENNESPPGDCDALPVPPFVQVPARQKTTNPRQGIVTHQTLSSPSGGTSSPSENNESPPGDCDLMICNSASTRPYSQKTTNPRQGIVTRCC